MTYLRPRVRRHECASEHKSPASRRARVSLSAAFIIQYITMNSCRWRRSSRRYTSVGSPTSRRVRTTWMQRSIHVGLAVGITRCQTPHHRISTLCYLAQSLAYPDTQLPPQPCPRISHHYARASRSCSSPGAREALRSHLFVSNRDFMRQPLLDYLTRRLPSSAVTGSSGNSRPETILGVSSMTLRRRLFSSSSQAW